MTSPAVIPSASSGNTGEPSVYTGCAYGECEIRDGRTWVYVLVPPASWGPPPYGTLDIWLVVDVVVDVPGHIVIGLIEDEDGLLWATRISFDPDDTNGGHWQQMLRGRFAAEFRKVERSSRWASMV